MANARDLSNALRRLIEPDPGRARLPAAEARADIAAAMGVGEPTDEGGEGIASPLVELADTRTFHDHDLTSSDGLFVFEDFIQKNVSMVDANGRSVLFVYDNPYDADE